MKKKIIIFVLIGVLTTIFVGTSIFFVLQGISASNKEWEYIDIYRARAEEYIRSSPEIAEKYGEDASIEFDNSVTYQRNSKQSLSDKILGVFSPDVPKTVEEFSANIKMMKFNVKINRDEYEIIFEKNDLGELEVSSVTPK